MNRVNLLIITSIMLATFANSMATESMPWGQATIEQQTYQSQKVVYDLTAGNQEKISNILSRAGYLSKLNGDDPFANKIIIIIHDDAIPFFSIANIDKYRQLMKLAHSQTLNGTIAFKMCQASARLRGLTATDIHGFVSMVPMADAEIVRLQEAGFAYMR